MTVKRLVLTRHAEARMVGRGLSPAWIERTAREPQRVEPEPRDPSAERRFPAIDELGGRVLRVVCVETETTIRVVTATLDRGARRA